MGRNMKQFRGGIVSKAHSLLYHLTLGSRVIKKKQKGANSQYDLAWTYCRNGARAESRSGQEVKKVDLKLTTKNLYAILGIAEMPEM